MEINQITSAVMVFLTGLLPASCHKADAKKSPPSAIVANATNSNVRLISGNIGQITLTNHADTCVEFANGASCILTPKIVDRNSVRITLALEFKDDYGETKDISVTEVVATQGKPTEVALGKMNLNFTPVIVGN
jgi:hypothetical protein